MTSYARAVASGKVVAGRAVRLACERHLRDREQGKARGLRWAPELARRAIAFFPALLRLVEGVHAHQPFVLERFQQFIVGSLFGWLGRDGYRRYRHAYIEIGKGGGKALALDTQIPTPSGWTTMGALTAGDLVFDEMGAATMVTVATEAMVGHPCYRVRFSDGAEIVADAEHLWLTHALRSGGERGDHVRRTPKRQWQRWEPEAIRTTADIATTLRIRPSRSGHPQPKWNHRVAVARPLELPEADLPIHPYVLGIWLGDGDSECARITVGRAGEQEMLAVLTACGLAPAAPRRDPRTGAARIWLRRPSTLCARGHSRNEDQARDGHCRACERATDRARRHGEPVPARTNPTIHERLRMLGLFERKHIPAQYLRASQGQRMALLQGLMDADGYISAAGALEFSVCDERLALDFLELVRTLGVKPTMTLSNATLRGRIVGPRWRVRFQSYADLPVFRLGAKRDRLRSRPCTHPLSSSRMIVACEPIDSVPVKCIKVETPSGLFLASRHFVPTHNTPMLAGILLYGLVEDGEQGAELYTAAVAREQAKIAFRDAAAMAAASPGLAKRLVIGENNIAYDGTRSFLRPLSSEARSLDGRRVHMAGVDELHEHQTALVTDKMSAGTKGRRQPLVIEITNAGYDRTSVCWRHHEYGLRVLEGAVDNDAWFAYVCQLDACAACRADGAMQPRDECSACDDWRDERVWIKANPGLGPIVTMRYLREQVQAARGMPAKESLVRRLNFCQWTESHSRWLDLEAWHACAGDVTDAELAGAPAFAGLDLGQSDDFSALALVWWLEDGRVAVRMRYWLPEVALAAKPERKYDAWRRAGHLTVTEGNVTDYDLVEREVLEACRTAGVRELAYDKRFAAQMALHLQGAGLGVVDMPQGYALNEPLRKIHDLVKARQLCHGGDPILAWMAANAVVRHGTRGEIRLDKDQAQEKIDGVAALAMAMGRAMAQPDTTSVYDQRAAAGEPVLTVL